jgi:hypothetical protein
MKRWKVAALAAFCLSVLSVGSAFAAEYIVDHPYLEPVKWRTHKLTAASGEVLFTDNLCNLCAVDSATTNRLGVASGSSPLDTTTAISTLAWTVPHANTGLASDSAQVLAVLNVYDPSTLCVSGADSIYIATQGSVDGNTWVTLRTFKNGTISAIASRLDQTNVTGAFQGLLSQNGAALANGQPVWRYRFTFQLPNAGQDAVDRYQLYHWPLIRFIVCFDKAYKYGVNASIWHPVSTVSF